MADSEDFEIRVTNDIEAASRNFDALDERIAQSARLGVERLGLLDRAVGRIGSSITGVAGRIHPVVAGATRLIGTLQNLQSRAEQVLERSESVVQRVGGGLEEKFETFKLSLEELRAAFVAAFFGGISGFGESSGITRFLEGVADRATRAARALQGYVESYLPLERRSNVAVETMIESLTAQIAVVERLRAQLGQPADGGGMLQLRGLNMELQMLTERRQLLRDMLEDRGDPFGHLNIEEIDKQIEALKRRNLELRLQAETFRMAADEATRYRLEQLAIEAAGSRWASMNQQQRQAWREQVEEQARLNAVIREQRNETQTERLVNSANLEIGRIAAQTRALTMAAGAAARMAFEERETIKFRQAGVPITDRVREQIAQLAEEFGRNTEQLKELQRQMQMVQEVGNMVARSLERAFSDWLSGTETSWKKLFNTLARDMAVLTLRQNVLQPLFGGGGVQQGGWFGQLLMNLLPGAAGGPSSFMGPGGWFTTVTPFGGGRAEGGPVVPGMGYMVGERGPEPFFPDVPGTVLPNGALGGATINMRVDLAGANGDETIARISGQAARAAAAAAVEQSNAAFPARQRRLHMLGS